MKKKEKFYSLKKILEKDCQYNIIYSKRSDGKTYAVLKYALERFVKKQGQFAIIRRMREDFRGKRATQVFDNLVSNDEIAKMTNYEWTHTYYYSGKWYLARWDEDLQKDVHDTTPFAYSFALTEMEHDKSTAYPFITTIFFDEFLSRTGYLTDEFVLFMNTISTIIRHRTDVKIFMAGNTINKYCPYFREMGLSHIKEMRPGKIDVYTYGEEGKLRVAVEYSETSLNKSDSDIYFAFDNPRLKMITEGAWEVDIYPHRPVKYKDNDIVFSYFIEFDDDLLQCDIVSKDNMIFTFIHLKTTPIQNPESDIVFTTEYNPRPNYFRKINKPTHPIVKKLYEFFLKEKVFFQDNEIGEIVRNYLMWCNKQQ